MSLFQLPLGFNDRFERNYQQFVKVPSSRSEKVGELPSFYTDVEEIADPPHAYYFPASTVNIPGKISNSDLASIMKKQLIEWLEQIPSLNEFTLDSSWSVYNARKDDTEIVPCVNSILPLLRQSVGTYSMQKPCIEVAKNAVDALNPDHMTVDASDQPIYALSGRLQLLQEIHRQLIARSGFAQFLDQAKVSSTGTRNVEVNVSQITSA